MKRTVNRVYSVHRVIPNAMPTGTRIGLKNRRIGLVSARTIADATAAVARVATRPLPTRLTSTFLKVNRRRKTLNI